MMNRTEVSVLMSIYNNESSVDASIASIVGQTFPGWEMILWNDASTDGSLARLEEWERRDKRIRVFSNRRNLGLAASLNLALEQSSGAFIARMDGDDVSLPERLERQIEFMHGHPEYAILGTGCLLFDGDGEWGERHGVSAPQKKDFLWGSQFIHPSTMMRRDALTSVGGYRVCHDTLRTEDYDLFMRMYAAGFTGCNLSEPLLRYYEKRTPRRVRYAQRISEAKIRWSGFKALHLMPRGLHYVIKPLVVGLIPGGIRRRLQQRRYAARKGGC